MIEDLLDYVWVNDVGDDTSRFECCRFTLNNGQVKLVGFYRNYAGLDPLRTKCVLKLHVPTVVIDTIEFTAQSGDHANTVWYA